MDQTSFVILVILSVIVLAIAVFLVWFVLNKYFFSHQKVRDLSAKDLERKRSAFQEELHRQGMLDLEQVVSDNADFIKQDVHNTATQLNDYMKQAIKKTMDAEFAEHHRASEDVADMLSRSMSDTRARLESQQQSLTKQMQDDLVVEKQRLIKLFEDNMSEVIGYYLTAVLGDKLSVNDQLEYILSELEANKQAIIEDLENGL